MGRFEGFSVVTGVFALGEGVDKGVGTLEELIDEFVVSVQLMVTSESLHWKQLKHVISLNIIECHYTI